MPSFGSWRARGVVISLLVNLILMGLADPLCPMTCDDARALWANEQIATATVGQLTGARQAFLDQASAATELANKEEASYRAATCLYYLKKGDKEDKTFHKEAGDVIAQYPDSPHNDELAFRQALTFVDREHWGFVLDQMGQYLTARPSSALVPQAAYYNAIALGELNKFEEFTQAVAAFHQKYSNADLGSELDFRVASLPYKNRKWKEAQAALDAFANQHAQTALGGEAAYRSALCLDEMGYGRNFKQAVARYAGQYPVGGHLPDLRLREALLPYRLENWPEARASLNDVATSCTDSRVLADAKFYAAMTLYQQKDVGGFASAVDSYRQQYATGDNVDELAFRAASLAFEKEQWSEGRSKLLQFVSARPNSKWAPQASFEASLCSLRSGDRSGFKSQIGAFETQFTSRSLVELTNNEIDRLNGQGRWAEGAALADGLLAEDPDLTDAYLLKFLKGTALLTLEQQSRPADMIDKGSDRWKQGEALVGEFIRAADAILASEDKAVRMNLAQRNHLENMICDALFREMEYGTLAERAARYAEEHKEEPVLWARFTNWGGMARLHMTEADKAAAAEAFESVIRAGVTDTNFDAHTVIQALDWRIQAAQNSADVAKAKELAVQLRDAMPDCPLKIKMCGKYKDLLKNAR